jgi:hypothetical protein
MSTRISNNVPLLNRLINKQFEFAKLDVKFGDIEKGIKIKVGPKEKHLSWYEYYFFEEQEDYQKWREWLYTELLEVWGLKNRDDVEGDVNYVDLIYGMNVRIKKEGVLL